MTEQERAELVEALRGVEEPVTPVDGDCEPWSKWIVTELREAGIAAKVQWMLGMATFPGFLQESPAVPTVKVMVFGHAAVLVGSKVIVDFTARQFNPLLPSRWIVDLDEYQERLAQATRVTEIALLREARSTTAAEEQRGAAGETPPAAVVLPPEELGGSSTPAANAD